jgi:hypothetical protein
VSSSTHWQHNAAACNFRQTMGRGVKTCSTIFHQTPVPMTYPITQTILETIIKISASRSAQHAELKSLHPGCPQHGMKNPCAVPMRQSVLQNQNNNNHIAILCHKKCEYLAPKCACGAREAHCLCFCKLRLFFYQENKPTPI